MSISLCPELPGNQNIKKKFQVFMFKKWKKNITISRELKPTHPIPGQE